MGSTSSLHSVHVPSTTNLRNRIESLAARLAGSTSKITLKSDDKGQAALWEEEMTTHRAGFTTPSRLGCDFVATRGLSLQNNKAKRSNAWAMGVGGALIGIFGVTMLATAVVPHVAGAVLLVVGVGLVAAAAVHYWRAGAPQRTLARVRKEAGTVQSQLQQLLFKLNHS